MINEAIIFQIQVLKYILSSLKFIIVGTKKLHLAEDGYQQRRNSRISQYSVKFSR